MSFRARYHGRCVACEGGIHEGDLIFMTEDGSCHDACAEIHVERPEPTDPCPTCWLVHPEGACDR